MGLNELQYRDIMFEYDQRRIKNRQILEKRQNILYQTLPELKAIHDTLVELSIEQARLELLSPNEAAKKMVHYRKEQEKLFTRKKGILIEHHYPEDYLEPIYTCCDCHDTGYIGQKPCHCLKQAKLKTLYENSGLNDILNIENFDTFSEEYYDDTTICYNLSITPRENIKRIRQLCMGFIKHFDTQYSNFLFYGPTGVGKTFLTHCIAKELLDRGYAVVYLTSLQLFDILEKNRFAKAEGTSTNEQVEHILTNDLLIIDDLGTELSNSFTSSQLHYLIEERHQKRRSTIISTNLSFMDIRERYSERILSRFTGYYDFKQIVGDDIRTLKSFQSTEDKTQIGRRLTP